MEAEYMNMPEFLPAPAMPMPERALVASRFGKIIPNRIFIGGLSKDTTEEDLQHVFSAYGTIKATRIVLDRNGVSKGYGFVTFEHIEEAQRIQKDVDSVLIKDVKIKISPAIRKQNIMNLPNNFNNLNHINLSNQNSFNIPNANASSASINNSNNNNNNQQHSGLPDPASLPLLYQQSVQYPPIYQCNNFPLGMPLFWQPYF